MDNASKMTEHQRVLDMDVDINDLERVIRCNNGKSSLLAIIDFVRFTMDGTK